MFLLVKSAILVFISDERTRDWFMLDSPGVILFLLFGLYLPFCKILGPWLMRDRKPWGLRKTMIGYNAFQVAFSFYIFYEVSSKLPAIYERFEKNQHVHIGK
jgi:uncharacterized Tic20 family protein